VPPAKHEWPVVHGSFEEFVSPIDKTLIDDRGKLRRHMKKHGVTFADDYKETLPKREEQRLANLRGDSKEAAKDRRETILRALGEHGL